MKSVKIIISILLLGLVVFAQVQGFSELRKKNDAVLRSLLRVNDFCPGLEVQTVEMHAALMSIEKSARALVRNTRADSARLFQLFGLAQTEVFLLNRDCPMKLNNSKLLLEMYLVNIDTEMMILQYGVNSDSGCRGGLDTCSNEELP